MALQVIDHTATTSADPATVYGLLRDGASWPAFSGLGSFELERPSDDGEPGEGLGAIRIFRTKQPIGQIANRELIVEAVPNERYAYELLEGLPFRDYRATIELTPEGAGTRIHWRSTFRGKFPGIGPLYRRSLDGFIAQLVAGLAEYAPTVAGTRP
jgi:hypothetical protein